MEAIVIVIVNNSAITSRQTRAPSDIGSLEFDQHCPCPGLPIDDLAWPDLEEGIEEKEQPKKPPVQNKT